MTEERVLAGTEEVVIFVVCRSGVRCTELTCEKGIAFLVCCGDFAGIMAQRPVPLVKKTLTVAAGAW